MADENENSIITIGLPVYNGEKFIDKRIDSILTQTFSNFELIISDNASTDSTLKICEEYAKKDKRIQIIKQERNIGLWNNFKFILNKTNKEYFVWAAVDDYWLPTFLEKNLNFLKSDRKFVASISKISYFGTKRSQFYPKNQTKIRRYYSYDDYPVEGNFDERIKFYLRLNRAENMYSVFRSKILQNCCNIKQSAGFDLAILLAALKFGEIKIIEEELMFRSTKGYSSRTENKNVFNLFNDYGLLGKSFPWLPFTFWFIKNIGIRNFLKNFDYLLFENISSIKYQLKHLKN